MHPAQMPDIAAEQRGCISFVLDFFVTFFVKKKSNKKQLEISGKENFVNRLNYQYQKIS